MMDLQERMSLFIKGQVTWPDPDKHGDARCAECRHYAPHTTNGGSKTETGRCDIVRALTGKQGLLFHGQKGMACTKFKRW